MNTATPKRSLRFLENQLQQRLDAQLLEMLENSPIQVRCAIKNADLLVLAQHKAGVRPDLQQTFKAIHQAILSLSPELTGELRLYLRVFGQVQPYAYHAFKLPQPLGEVSSDADSVSPLTAFAWLEKLSEDHGNPRSASAPGSAAELSADRVLTNENRLALPPGDETMTNNGGNSGGNNGGDNGGDNGGGNGENEEFSSVLLSERQKTKFPELPSWWGQVSAYFLLSLTLCSVSLYAFTRPCVLGKCETIAQAQQQMDEAQQILAEAKNAQQFAQAQDKFNLATEQLKQIPVWSGKHKEARRSLTRAATEATQIERVMTAMETGAAAWKKAQNSPLPLETWQAIEVLWSEAIALLEQIPPGSQLYPFAQKKLSEYEANLQAIVQRVKQEEQAAETLKEIRTKADLAYTRQGVATGLESWQGIYDLWQETVNLIPRIPPSTMAYIQLQDSVAEYRKQLVKARQQQVQEKISQETYNLAIAAAEQAQQLAEQKQWSKSLNHWTDALRLVREVPENTFYSAKAQSLVTSYTNARNEVAVNLKTATILQKTQNDLKKLCNGSPVICEYTVTEDVINVWLTPAYVRHVKRTALLADQKGDHKALVSIDQHLETLKVALQTISDNAEIPLMLYDAYGGLIGRHPKN